MGYAVLGVAILCGVSLRTANILGKHWLHHDETIAYLASTGHQGAFAKVIRDQSPPLGQWSKASEWKRFVRTEHKLCFGTIGHDLSRHDIHPPLYFWVLHVWGIIFGVEILTGPTLNVVLYVLGALALYMLARDLLRNSLSAAIVVLLWSASSGVITSSYYARPYELMGLCTILFVWFLNRASDRARECRWPMLAGAALVGTAGLLTHYHFAIMMIGGVLFVTARLIRKDRRRLAFIGGAFLLSAILFVVLHPGFLNSFELAKTQAQPAGSEAFSQRIGRAAVCYAVFFADRNTLGIVNHNSLEIGIYSVLAILVIWAGIRYFVARQDPSKDGENRSMGGWVAVFFLIWAAGVNIALYVAFISPTHAMTPRYLTTVWPFYAFIPVLLFSAIPRGRAMLTVLLCLGVFAGGVMRAVHTHSRNGAVNDPTSVLSASDWLLADDVRRGMLTRVVWRCPNDFPVYAAPEAYLVAHSSQWLDRTGETGLYVNTVRSVSGDRQWSILKPLAQRSSVMEVPGGFWNLGRAYRITAR